MFYLDEPFVSDLLLSTSKKFAKNNKIYTNSENSLEKIIAENPDISPFINLFKDKVKFREFLKSIYPDFFFEKVSYEGLISKNFSELKYPCVIKP